MGRDELLSSRASTGKSIHASGRAARARAAATTPSGTLAAAAAEASGGSGEAGRDPAEEAWSDPGAEEAGAVREKPPRREPPISARSERIPARIDGDGGAAGRGDGDRRVRAVGVAGGESVWAGLRSGWRKQAMSRR